MFLNNILKRARPTQPAPQPVRPPFTSAFGQPFARAPQPAPQPVRPPFTSAFGQPFARAPQPTSGVGNYSGPIPQSRLMTDSETAAHNAAFDKMRADVAALPKNSGFFGNMQPIARAPQPVQGPSAFSNMFGNGGFGQPIQSPFLGGLGGGQPMPAQQTPQPTTGLSGLGALSPEQITQLQNSMGPQTLPANINQELAKMSPGYANTGTQNMTGGLSSLGLS